MKRQLLTGVLSLLMTLTASAQRFLSEVFTSVTETQNVIYGNNISVLSGTPTATDLFMDVYEPAGPDPLAQRPLIILLHTGSFLPTFINQTPTGNRRDSNVVEMARQFARRGYVAAAMSYRLGWNPAATGGGANEDIRRGTLLQAVYRSIQDAKACVRFFKNDQANSNTFRIDSTNIILGGMGSGGYTALAYATLDLPGEITLPKFLSNNNVPAPYNFMVGVPYVLQGLLGDFDGFGGNAALNNPNNTPGHTNDIHFVFNMGGALGDSIWMAPGDAPMVSFHVVGDPFAPYGYGPVIVPTTLDYVVHVSGSSEVIKLAAQFGNEDCFNMAGFNDPYTIKANSMNGGLDGLYPFYTNPLIQAAPWEWFDSLATVAGAQQVGLTPAQGSAIYSSGLLTNPDMSKTKALTYIDTVMSYLNPRIVECLSLPVGINEVVGHDAGITLSPNPVYDYLEVKTNGDPMIDVSVIDASGRLVFSTEVKASRRASIDFTAIPKGVYLVKVNTARQTHTRLVTK